VVNPLYEFERVNFIKKKRKRKIERKKEKNNNGE